MYSSGNVIYDLTVKQCKLNVTCASNCAFCTTASSDSSCSTCAAWNQWLSVTDKDTAGSCVASATIASNFSAYGRLLTYSSTNGCVGSFTKNAPNFQCSVTSCTASNCASCGSSATACWKCNSGYITSGDPEGTCQSSCSAGYALNSDSTRCAKCHSNCTSCSVPNSAAFCWACSGSLVVESPPSYCRTTCPAGKIISNGVCVVPGSGSNILPSAISDDNEKWYAAAIVLGIVGMLAFFAFIGYLIVKWPDKDAEAPEAAGGASAPAQPVIIPPAKSSAPAQPQAQGVKPPPADGARPEPPRIEVPKGQ